MHAVIIENLEEYLAGTLPPAAERRFRAHLESCGACHREVTEMREAASLFAELKPAGEVEPPLGFAASVMRRAVEGAPERLWQFWNPFTDFAFGRRLVFGSLLTLAVLGSIFVSRETTYAAGPSTPAAVMSADDGSPTPDRMLVTLASYEP